MARLRADLYLIAALFLWHLGDWRAALVAAGMFAIGFVSIAGAHRQRECREEVAARVQASKDEE